jgi:hypothetical protein
VIIVRTLSPSAEDYGNSPVRAPDSSDRAHGHRPSIPTSSEKLGNDDVAGDEELEPEQNRASEVLSIRRVEAG